ncbi:MAG TPA: hypothetical protein VN646_02815 [Candidatus Acidoferrum sp.]|jgi:hypothetical protein|nr:hypothetical protein [Candidatus Acidoferrum sp.]
MILPTRHRSDRLLVAASLLIAGCATMSNTLAQDLAYERVRQCQHVSNIILQRIDPDGRVWVEMRNGTAGYAEWQECMRQAGVDQASARKGPVAGSSVPPPAAASSPMNGPLTAPHWNVGEEWAFRWEGPAGRGTYIISFVREERLDGLPCYVVKTGQNESFYRQDDLALVRETRDGAVTSVSVPPRPQFEWPLTVGKRWEQVVTLERRQDRTTTETPWSWEVQSEETITVPAGTFRTVRIDARNQRTGAPIYEMWYAPEVKWWVRLREHLRSGTQERELIGFRMRGA